MIEHHIGMDVSKFFYGGYVLEHSSKQMPVLHSNIARKIVNKLIVARLNDRAHTFSATIIETSQVNKSTSTFVMRPIGSEC